MTTMEILQTLIDRIQVEDSSNNNKSESDENSEINSGSLCSQRLLINDKSELDEIDSLQSDDTSFCRICREQALEDANPLMMLGCCCKGNLGQAHKNCLLEWFRHYSSEHCEICKSYLSPPVLQLIRETQLEMAEAYDIQPDPEWCKSLCCFLGYFCVRVVCLFVAFSDI